MKQKSAPLLLLNLKFFYIQIILIILKENVTVPIRMFIFFPGMKTSSGFPIKSALASHWGNGFHFISQILEHGTLNTEERILICFIVAAVMINSVFTVASGNRKSIHQPTIQVVRNSFRRKQIKLGRKLDTFPACTRALLLKWR